MMNNLSSRRVNRNSARLFQSSFSKHFRLVLLRFLTISFFLLSPSTSEAMDLYWQVSFGDWSTAANWSGFEPTSSHNAYIVNGGTAYITQLGETCNYFYLGDSGTGTVTMTGGSLSATYQSFVGNTGIGTFTQSAGSHTTLDLCLGFQSGSTGMYNLIGPAQLSSRGGEIIGYYGTGTFTQTSGTHSITGSLQLGYKTGSSGTYNLIGTGQLSARDEYIGGFGTGTFTQSGGINSITHDLQIGTGTGHNGMYNLSGGTLSTTNLYIGNGGTGRFEWFCNTLTTTTLHISPYNQNTLAMGFTFDIATLTSGALYHGSALTGLSSASLEITNGATATHSGNTSLTVLDLSLGSSTGNGTYSLYDSGQLYTDSLRIGDNGIGTFNHTGGTNLASVIILGFNYGSTGTYNLSGTGQITAKPSFSASALIGYRGTGIFNQSEGINTVTSSFMLGYYPGSSGTYNLTGGTLVLSEISKGSGYAAFNFGGGTLKAYSSFTTTLPITLTGINGHANIDDAGHLVTLSGALSGTGGLTKAGLGTLTLTGTNVFTGSINFNGGMIKAATLSNLGNGTAFIFNGGGLQFDGVYDPSVCTMTFQAGGATFDTQTNNITLSNAIGNGGSGGLTKQGSGTLTLTGTNTFTGPVNFNGGMIKAATLSNLGNGTAFNFNGGRLQFDGVYDPSVCTMTFQAGGATFDTQTNNITLSNAIGNGGSGGLTKLGSGLLTVSSSPQYLGNTVISSGNIVLGSIGSGVTLPNTTAVNLTSSSSILDTNGNSQNIASLTGVTGSEVKLGGGTLTTGSNNSTTTFSGTITDSISGTLSKIGTGTFTLTGTNTFTGPVNFNGGMIKAATLSNLGNGTAFIFNGGGLQFDGVYDPSVCTMTFQAGGATFDTRTNNITLSNAIGNGGSGGLTKQGSGTLTLTGTNTFTGPVNFNGGMIKAATLSNLGNGTAFNFNGGRLQFDGVYDPSVCTMTFQAGGATFDTQTNNITLSNAIGNGGSGGLTKLGSGLLTVSSSPQYLGNTVISSGNIVLGSIGSGVTLPNTTAVNLTSSSSILDTNGNSQNIASLTGVTGSEVKLGGGTLTTGSNNSTTTFSGTITDSISGTLSKIGTGTFTLTGTNTFTGPVNFNGGMIKAATLSNLGNGTAFIFNGGGLQFDGVYDPSVCTMTFQAGGATFDTRTNNITLSNAIGNGGSGGLTKQGSGTLTLTGTNTFTGPVNFNGGMIKAATLSNLGNGTAFIFNGGGLQFDGVYDPSVCTMTFQAGGATFDTQTNNITLSNAIGNGGSGGLTKLGSGTLTLTGTNTFTGPVIFNGGMIKASKLSNLGNGASFSLFFNGGGMQFDGVFDPSSRIMNIQAGGATLDTQANNITLYNAIGNGGTGGLKKNGSGILTLAGTSASAYTGLTIVNSGTLLLAKTANVKAIAGGLAIGDSINSAIVQYTGTSSDMIAGSVSINRSGILDFNGKSDIIGNVTISSNSTYLGQIINTAGGGALTIGTLSFNCGGNIATSTGKIILGGDVTYTTDTNGIGATISGHIDLNSTRTFTIADESGSVTDMDISAVIADGSGISGMIKGGLGTLTLTGTNVFTGPVNFNGGMIKAATLSNLGNGTAFIFNGGRLQFDGVYDPSVCTMTFQAGGATLDTQANNITLSNAIGNSGNGGLIKQGSGILTLSGTSANIYNGLTKVNSGTLLLAKTANVKAIGNGGLTIGNGTDAATVQYTGSSTDMMGTGAVTINARGSLDFNGKSDAIGSVAITSNNTYIGQITNSAGSGVLTIGTLGFAGGGNIATSTGKIVLGGNVYYYTGANGIPATIVGSINLNSTRTFTIADDVGLALEMNISAVISNGSSTSGLTKAGAGTLTLNALNTYSGNTTVNGGTLAIAGGIGSSGTSLIDIQSGTTVLKTVNVNNPDLDIYIAALAAFEVVNGIHTVGVIQGSGLCQVDSVANLIAESIICDTLTIGSGANIDIQQNHDRPLTAQSQTSSVPEPATITLLMLAGFGLGLWRCGKRGWRVN